MTHDKPHLHDADAIQLVVVHPDQNLKQCIFQGLRQKQYPIRGAETAKAGLDSLGESETEILLLSSECPDMTWNEVMSELQVRRLCTPVLLMTPPQQTRLHAAMLQTGAADCVVVDSEHIELLVIRVNKIISDVTERRKTLQQIGDGMRRYEKLFLNSLMGIGLARPDGQIIETNDAFATILGYTRDELLRVKSSDLYKNIADRERAIQILDKNAVLSDFETTLKRKDGKEVHVLLSSSKIEYNGETFYQTTCLDISARKQAENQLRAQEKLFQDMLKAVPDSISVHDTDLNIVYCNWNGFSAIPEDKRILNSKCYKTLRGYHKQCPDCRAGKVIQSKKTHRSEIELSDGKWMDLRIIPLLDHNGNCTHFVEWVRDISDRKQLEQQQRDYVRELELITDTLVKSSRITDLNALCQYLVDQIHSFNPKTYVLISMYEPETGHVKVRAMAGYGKILNRIYKMIGADKDSFNFHPEDMGELTKLYVTGKLVQVPGGAYDLLEHKVPKSICDSIEKLLNVDASYGVGFSLNNEPYGGIVILTQKGHSVQFKSAIETIASHASLILHRRQAEQAAESLNERIQAGLKAGNLAWWELQLPSGKVQFDDMKATALGYKPESFTQYQDFTTLIHPEDREKTIQAMRDHLDGKTDRYHVEYRIRARDESYKWYRDMGSIVEHSAGNGTMRLIGIVEDITESKQSELERAKLEAQLHRSQKLETIGTLSGGIAHDFNNILTPILGYAEMGRDALEASHPVREDLQYIIEGAERAKELIQQIMTFSRNESKQKTPLYLHTVVRQAVKLMRATIPTTVDIRKNIDTTCPAVLADATQMHQVMVNLCTNAYQALSDKGGYLKIELNQTTVDEKTALLDPELKVGDYVQLVVQDNGVGMDENTMNRIFEPFFTTQKGGRGTGLGLSVVHGIVKGHNGAIVVESEPNQGTLFSVYIPVSQADVQDESQTQNIPAGKGKILVVDDETAIASMLNRMLKKLGYQVDSYTHSPDALDVLRHKKAQYDLVLTDLTMPELDGIELAQEIRKLDKKPAVVLMTGYSEQVRVEQSKHLFERVLAKPINRREIALIVQETIRKTNREAG
ncbi:MAG: PAS domain S-box protein [candidate division KSB1 bacterium]|nr:PAS domain S-box protein [candidate division KSB1 bacterium]